MLNLLAWRSEAHQYCKKRLLKVIANGFLASAIICAGVYYYLTLQIQSQQTVLARLKKEFFQLKRLVNFAQKTDKTNIHLSQKNILQQNKISYDLSKIITWQTSSLCLQSLNDQKQQTRLSGMAYTMTSVLDYFLYLQKNLRRIVWQVEFKQKEQGVEFVISGAHHDK